MVARLPAKSRQSASRTTVALHCTITSGSLQICNRISARCRVQTAECAVAKAQPYPAPLCQLRTYSAVLRQACHKYYMTPCVVNSSAGHRFAICGFQGWLQEQMGTPSLSLFSKVALRHRGQCSARKHWTDRASWTLNSLRIWALEYRPHKSLSPSQDPSTWSRGLRE